MEFETYVEIPITVHASQRKAQGDGHNEPHIPAHIHIDDIELKSDLKDWILNKYYEDLQKEATE